ncbi:MAG: hypothetical protein E6J61_12690 [Deltaproteobacteria bacterium]|nr:MAG: hypothetical protein E6J61_12690 [Deltaproteobacteria bacterium]
MGSKTDEFQAADLRLQVAGNEVRVALRRHLGVSVAEHLLHGPEVGAGGEEQRQPRQPSCAGVIIDPNPDVPARRLQFYDPRMRIEMFDPRHLNGGRRFQP